MELKRDNDNKVVIPDAKNEYFYEPIQFSDLTILISKTKYHVHKSLVCLRSTMFRDALSTDLKCRELDFTDLSLFSNKSPSIITTSFHGFLSQLYQPDISKGISYDNLPILADYADYFQCSSLAVACEEFVLKQHSSRSGTVLDDIVFCEEHKMPNVIRTRLEELHGNLGDYRNNIGPAKFDEICSKLSRQTLLMMLKYGLHQCDPFGPGAQVEVLSMYSNHWTAATIVRRKKDSQLVMDTVNNNSIMPLPFNRVRRIDAMANFNPYHGGTRRMEIGQLCRTVWPDNNVTYIAQIEVVYDSPYTADTNNYNYRYDVRFCCDSILLQRVDGHKVWALPPTARDELKRV